MAAGRETQILEEEVGDIYVYPIPPPPRQYPLDTILTKGDLHANPISMLHFLIRNGVMTLKDGDEDYDALVGIYETEVTNLTRDDLDDFRKIIQEATFNKNIAVRWLGDMFADRGELDYYIALILEAMDKAEVPYEIMLSNHDFQLIRFYEKAHAEIQSKTLSRVPSESGMETFWKIEEVLDPVNKKGYSNVGQSLDNLALLYERDVIDVDRLAYFGTIIKDHYLTHLNICSYDIDQIPDAEDPRFTYIEHAPVEFVVIKELADLLGVEYHTDNLQELAETINNINNTFYTNYIVTNQISTLCGMTLTPFLQVTARTIPENELVRSNPVYRSMWARGNDIGDGDREVDQDISGPYGMSVAMLRNMHGHDGAGKGIKPDATQDPRKIFAQQQYVNMEVDLDNTFAKNKTICNGKDKITAAPLSPFLATMLRSKNQQIAPRMRM